MKTIELHTHFSQFRLHLYWISSLLVAWRMWWMLWSLFLVPKKIRVAELVVVKMLCTSTLDVQKFIFKITIKSNAKVALGLLNIISPLTKMWKIISNSSILCHNISKYVKLVEIAMIQVLSLVEDKWTFNNLNLIKTKICNPLIENLALCVCMFRQSFFTMHNFQHDETMGIW